MDPSVSIPAIIGGVAGLFSGLLASLVIRWLDSRGKLQVFYNPTFADQRVTWSANSMLVPMRVEFFNTSRSARQVRDCCLYLHLDDGSLTRFEQVRGTKTDSELDENSYSFVVAPSGVEERFFEFGISVPEVNRGNGYRGVVSLSYLDDRGKRMTAPFFQVSEESGSLRHDLREGYRELKFKKAKIR